MKIDFDKLAADGAANFTTLIKEAHNKLKEAWADAEDEAELEKANPTLRISYSIVLDPAKANIEYKVTFKTSYSRSINEVLEDPDQETLPLESDGELESLEISAGAKTVKLDGKALPRIKKTLRRIKRTQAEQEETT